MTTKPPSAFQRNGTLNGSVPQQAAPVSKPVVPKSPSSMAEMMTSIQEQQQVVAMQLHQQTQLHDLQCGNHDLMQGTKALAGGAQMYEHMAPVLEKLTGELSEFLIETKQSEGFFEFELEIEG